MQSRFSSRGLGHSLLAFLLVLTQCLAISPTAWAQQQEAKQETKEERRLREQEEKRKKEEEAAKTRQAKAREKQERKYNTLLEFAQDQYRNKLEFKDEVDKAYLDLQGQHAMQAYRINTQRNTELVYAESEDATLKIRRVLYDNPWVQDYVNRVGQRLVPADSDKLYAFRVTYHPIPYAYTLSTGTVLISTGMISMLDNEAQLAYVLAHELAHVYRDHWKTKIMMGQAEDDYNEAQARKAGRWAALAGLAGMAIGGAIAKNAEGVITGAGIGAIAGYVIGSIYNRQIGVDWETAHENEADDFAMRLMLDKSYDPQEVQKIYVALDEVARLDERVQLGFLGSRPRIRERREFADKLLGGQLQQRYQELFKAGDLKGSSPDYSLVMAELKRDNGIEAFKFDMFQMSRRNLQQAVNLRSDDVRATFYYGRVLRVVGRTPDELSQAEQYLKTAVTQDQARQNLPEVQLQNALLLMDKKDPASVQALKDYILEYQKRRLEEATQGGTVPPNLDTLYDLMRIFGKEVRWEPPRPGINVSTAVAPAAPSSTNDTGLPANNDQPAARGAQSTATSVSNPVNQIKERIQEAPNKIKPKKP